LAPLLRAFHRATGWELAVERSAVTCGEAWSTELGGDGDPTARLVVRPAAEAPGESGALLPLTEVRPLARSIAELVNENNRLRRALWQREAELAAGVPVSPRRDEEQHLATRLEAVLRTGAEAVGCQAAGLYVLNDATSELKLRAAWGLGDNRLLEPARPLRGAIADLEALTGHAVVLEDTALLPHWRCPEDFPAAACVPVSSPSVPLGTLWVFSSAQRDFSPQETNLLEIIAGRLAADLEREVLLSSGQAATEHNKQIAAGAQWLCDRLPSAAPLLDDYTVAGWTKLAAEVGGSFHDWTVLNDGRVGFWVGEAGGSPIEASLTAASLRALAAAHVGYSAGPGGLLTKINESVLASSPGGERSSLAYARLDPATGTLKLALAGQPAALIVGHDDRLVTTTDAPPIGEWPDFCYAENALGLRPGEVLLLLNSGVRAAVDPVGLRITEAALGSFLTRYLRHSAEELLRKLRQFLEHPQQIAKDMSVVIVKRRARREA
jgi:GAF domain-containing protein